MQALMRAVVPYNPYAMDPSRQPYIGQNLTEMAFNLAVEEGRMAVCSWEVFFLLSIFFVAFVFVVFVVVVFFFLLLSSLL
jgi:hypothetical protein